VRETGSGLILGVNNDRFNEDDSDIGAFCILFDLSNSNWGSEEETGTGEERASATTISNKEATPMDLPVLVALSDWYSASARERDCVQESSLTGELT
jgi:hypothetical protein